MPELPDLTIYIESLEARVVGRQLENIRLASPFLLRSVDPSLNEANGKIVRAIRRIGKRIVFELEGDYYLVLHLMIAGRLQWKAHGAKVAGKIALAAFDFPNGTLTLTEAGTKKRAAMHFVKGEQALKALDRGGLEVMDSTLEQFRTALLRENHTLKRTLTDPRLFSAIGNAYSDEILHRAKLSPLRQTKQLKDNEIARLHDATKIVLNEWIERFRGQIGDGFPTKVTAFHKEMAVHGKFNQPCPVCGTKVQRIVYAENECNYCPRCQTDGKVLADRSLSRLLKDDWPRTVEELEEMTTSKMTPS
ncbi:MAG: formamidopyrimidine-DNA glycosylase [Ignavibacteriae bacterium]|nr:formamidopyrimidine-DNA glycosylase [Ignavibacteriota bacterium]